jgi:hypothetical protein
MSPEVLARQVDTRLNQLKEQVIRDYCDNRVQGEMVLLSILSTLADSRSRLHVATGRSAGLKTAAPHPIRSRDVVQGAQREEFTDKFLANERPQDQ